MMPVVLPLSTGAPEDDEGPILDAAALAERCFGDRDLEADLLGLFVGQCRTVGAALLAATDKNAIRDFAHALRGSAAAIGAEPLAGALGRLEEAPDGFSAAARSSLGGLLDRTAIAAAGRLTEPRPLAKPDRLA